MSQSAAQDQLDPHTYPLDGVLGTLLSGPWPEKTLAIVAAEDEITVRWTGVRSGEGMRMTGGVVRDPAEIAAIRRRIQATAASRGAWRRALRRIRAGR